MLAEAEPPEALRMLRTGHVDVALVFRHYQPGRGSAAAGRRRGGRARHAAARRAGAPGDPGGSRPGRRRHGAVTGPPDLAAYAQRRWIAGCERCRGYLIRQCALAGFTPKIAFTTDDYVAVQALVAAGLGVTTLPGLCLRAARHPGIRAAPLPGARRHVFAMTYGDPPDPPATARLIDVLALAAGAEAPAA